MWTVCVYANAMWEDGDHPPGVTRDEVDQALADPDDNLY